MIDRTDAEYMRLRDDASTGLDGSPGNDTSKYAVDTIDALERENNQLRAELAKWKSGCEANADDARDCHLRSDERRRQIIELRADLKKCVEALKVIVRKHHLAGDECECIGSYYKALSTPSAQAILKQNQ